MACGSCGGKSAASNYPKQVKMPDGNVVTVTSAVDERAQRDKAFVRARSAKGTWTATNS